MRLFVTRDQLDRYVSCTLCLPRDRFNTENRQRTGQILAEAFGGPRSTGACTSESVLVRVDYVVHCPDGVPADYDVLAIEAQIVEATRDWSDDLRAALTSAHGEERGVALQPLCPRIPRCLPRGLERPGAVADIEPYR